MGEHTWPSSSTTSTASSEEVGKKKKSNRRKEENAQGLQQFRPPTREAEAAAQPAREEEERDWTSFAFIMQMLINVLSCPLTKKLMTMPVLAGDGWTYEFEALL